MLSFVFTDMPIAAPVLQGLLQPLIDKSFNAVTVDSDTSTSDTCLVFATGQAEGVAPITEAGDPRVAVFAAALGDVLHDLAMLVVRDGEGASKFVAVTVEGAVSDASAFRIARSIANSPLVKTAIAGEDANWGRVVMAVGKAGEPADRDKLSIGFGDITVAERGERAAGYDEAKASAYMKGQDLEIRVHIGLGQGSATVYTCDLTHGYIAINGDYRS
jgi:glutamate N-acetyltransferase/amino-acid N-acetyltransferase